MHVFFFKLYHVISKIIIIKKYLTYRRYILDNLSLNKQHKIPLTSSTSKLNYKFVREAHSHTKHKKKYSTKL